MVPTATTMAELTALTVLGYKQENHSPLMVSYDTLTAELFVAYTEYYLSNGP